ncbi:MAG TPA: hypothetical protein VFE10_06200 [Phenylobacterium sp.]|jgi:hypothetical protein|nr:hypothetical protein [Phenylobacterium sp.]
MSEQVVEDLEDLQQPAPDGELVHWMDPKPLTAGPAGVAIAVATGLVLGVAGTLAVLALAGWLGPDREIVAPRPRR